GVQLMQSIHHVVMPAVEPFVDPGCIEDRQFERSFQEKTALPVGERHERVEPDLWMYGTAGELHGNGTAGKVVDADRIAERHVEMPDRLVRVPAGGNAGGPIESC